MKLLTYSQKERKEAKERKTTTTTLHTKSNSFLSSLVGPPQYIPDDQLLAFISRYLIPAD